MSCRKKFDWLLNIPIAHRGLHDNIEIPENSILSFLAAIRRGLPIELDIHVTIDNEVVVFHDDNLQRMTGLNGLIEEKNLQEIMKIRLLNTEQKIPTLKQVLELVSGSVPLLIEIKNKESRKGIEPIILSSLINYKGDYAIQCFNPVTLGWFKTNEPKIIRGQLSGDFRDEDLFILKKFLLRRLFLNFLSKPDFISYDLRAIPYWAINRKRLPLIVWTVRNREDQTKALKLSDNYIFEGIECSSKYGIF